ncbi:hypothetical protein JDV02_007677 [Purpureocillium takamizusanense]|uniref:NOT2/NOT3/NOT5 C-terminal domain-containing protein n=1 Tax=Purpureocillium takamizusanense TaxID=2060973 RepID=A0A9Q8VCJ6_9HYPO|nr:uncharacterized protein JDV02_007677 [Purpureocillium takamizusanense]UNI21710.1 hypothetical protein JDV02_007677 [Purpureocillium takamizusanense]
MNRPGAVPQTIRGMPGNFGGQQQPQQPGRSVSSRLPNGKLVNNSNSGWAFGGGVPMGGAGFNQGRQLGGNVSFAQSLSGSQPATPLDPTEFPSLSTTPQLNSASQAWSNAGSRNPSGPGQRNQSTPISSQQGQDDIFTPPSTSRLQSSQGSLYPSGVWAKSAIPWRYFPSNVGLRLLRRAVDRENGRSDSADLPSVGFGPQAPGSGQSQAHRGNGLLNALSANSRASEARTPPGVGPLEGKQPQSLFRDDGFSKTPLGADAGSQATDARGSLGVIGNENPSGKSEKDKASQSADVVDPLSGMPAVDKWGIKGLRTLMNNYPDYHAMVVGMDPGSLGLDMTSPDLISTQNYSLFDDHPPRPTVDAGKFRLPDCYNVTNVQPIETKIQSFNEETLFWIFYSCPADIKQQMAAVELHSRNWRWHKKLAIWLTKDDHMTPQILSPNHERGYYVVWDAGNWRRDRRELTLHYGDLDTSLTQGPTLA